jgi:hypothetical protein
MGTGHDSEFCRLLDAGESHKILQRILIRTARLCIC